MDASHHQPAPPAGWYPDPSGAAFRRYWDGRQWTTATDPPAQRPPVHSATLDGPAAMTQSSQNDEQDGASIREFLNFELPVETFPVSNWWQKMVAEMLADDEVVQNGENPLIDALANIVMRLETSLVRTRTMCTHLTNHIIGLETRLIEARVRIRPATQEIHELSSALREL
jgi:hypothetical protein